MERLVISAVFAIEAIIFVMLIYRFSGDQLNWRLASAIAVITAAVPVAFASLLDSVFDFPGAMVGFMSGVAIVSALLSYIFGMDIKRASLIATGFPLVLIGVFWATPSIVEALS